MAAKGGRIDFMFLAPPPPSHWIRYWTSGIPEKEEIQLIGACCNSLYYTCSCLHQSFTHGKAPMTDRNKFAKRVGVTSSSISINDVALIFSSSLSFRTERQNLENRRSSLNYFSYQKKVLTTDVSGIRRSAVKESDPS